MTNNQRQAREDNQGSGVPGRLSLSERVKAATGHEIYKNGWPEGCDLIAELEADRQRLLEENKRFRASHARYEAVRKWSPGKFAEIYKKHISSDRPFDEIVDYYSGAWSRTRRLGRAEIARAYPDADVNVTDEQSLQTASVDCGDDYEQEQEALDFCSRLWDRCPWDWDVSE